MSEKTDQLAGQISAKASDLATLRGLTEHPGWKVFNDLLQSQADSRKGKILLQPLRSTEEVYLQEFMKGEISGLMLAQVSLFAVMEGLKADIQVDEVKLEKENELAAQVSPDGGSRVDSDDWHGGSEQPR